MLVHTPSYTFFILNGASAVLTYAKVEGDLFFFTWKMTLAPTLLYFVILSLSYLKNVIIVDKPLENASGLKMGKFQLLDNFFHFLLSVLMLLLVGLGCHIEDLDNGSSKKPLFIVAGIYLFTHLVYSIVGKKTDESLLPITNKEKSSGLLTTIMSPILNFLGGSFVLCSGGSCSGIYGSTISALFGAFGISVTEWLPFLDWLTLLLVLISIGMLYYAKRSFTYKPFLLSLFAGILIFADSLAFHIHYLTYIGNVLMIAGALWNSRANKANLFPFAKKKKTTV